MLPTIAWVALPLGAYAAYAGVSAWRKRGPTQRLLNIHTSLLLMAYLLVTAGLGIFWVANQQLPVFDLHYLFGYATLLLVAVHLGFNFPIAWRTLRASKRKEASAGKKRPPRGKTIGAWSAALLAVCGSFFLGMRHGRSDMSMSWSEQTPAGNHIDAIVKYHEFASHSRGSVFARSPGVQWGERPAPFKHIDGAKVVALPPPDANAGAIGPFSAQALSNMMHFAAGITQRRGGLSKRAAPSSGALFPTELYLVVRDVEGVKPGVYHYDPSQHRLEQVSNQSPNNLALGAPFDRLDETPATVVVTSIFRRTGFKYRDRAYRYAIADAGHLLENLRVATRTAGYWARPLRRFDEQQAEHVIGIDGIEEAVIALVSIELDQRGSSSALSLAPAPLSDGALGVTTMAQLATSLRFPPRDTPEPGDLIALPAATRTRPALTTIQERRSQRRFNSEPLSLEELAALLADTNVPPQLSRALRVNVVVNRVSELPKGVYRYHAYKHGLQRLREGDFQSAAHSAGLSQEVIGDAAAVFILSVDRTLMFGDAGARGYRHAFLEAGMIGERLLLSAVGRKLGACPVGAFYDDEASKLIGVSLDDEWVLHFAGVGKLDEQPGPMKR